MPIPHKVLLALAFLCQGLCGTVPGEPIPDKWAVPDSLEALSIDSLKAIPGEWRIDIHRDDTRLTLSKGDVLVRSYLCAVGNDTIGKVTPAGSYRIIGKIKNPPMYWRNGTRIPPGDWRNSYGPRWMSLGDGKRGTYRRYGIHGTNAPESIGVHISSGCIRLYNDDIIELYDFVPEGTPVFIH
jgi:lipoprotein-anchoring transpeptidase ErfK/SrfK